VGKTNQTEEFWRTFAEYSRVDSDYVVVAFGDNPRMATELAALSPAAPKSDSLLGQRFLFAW
jgi:hypothetical protein